MARMRVAIIGAGASGLTAIKCCIEEDLEPVCYERTSHLAGLWYYTPEPKEGQGCVMKSTVINTSKETMSYSDFPTPADFPVFMHNTKVVEYLKSYANHFDLEKYIRYNHDVITVKQADDFDASGRWLLRIKDKTSQNVITETFDAVLVCTGHHAEKRVPTFEGMDSFKGKIVHTIDYKCHVGYEDKRIVVIGIGNSGGDVAVELSRIAKQVFLSTRRGAWVLYRIAQNGYPIDMLLLSRIGIYILYNMPRSIKNAIVEWQLNSRFDHSLYGLKPKHRFDAQHPMVNDELPNRIACGSIKIKPDVSEIGPTSVRFTDGSTEEDVDVIILATGYKFGFPIIDHPAFEVKENVVNLFKYVFAPDVKPATLAIIGCIQPLGAIMPISEMQCRWATRVFKGLTRLPSSEAMWADIRKKQKQMSEQYVKSPRHTIQVDYIGIMDEIGEQIGCKPNIRKLFWEDPHLAFRCLFGSFLPYQYRLVGPHPWSGARKAIMTAWDRTLAGISSKQTPADSYSLISYIILMIVVAVMIKWIIFTFI